MTPQFVDPNVRSFERQTLDYLVDPRLPLKFKRLSDTAVLPQYQTEGAGAFDLAISEDVVVNGSTRSFAGYPIPLPITFAPTGLAVEIPEGYVLAIYPRSSTHKNWAVHLANTVGIIDSDYRGEIFLALVTTPGYEITIPRGTRLAQAILTVAPQANIIEVDELSETERGDGGCGSTGV